ncbi:hypothetical protein EV363DRAFT_1435596 [Boletus edulis]|nr:hypothetical protein EV363DRAFT_1435596 [Boletus edulis]
MPAAGPDAPACRMLYIDAAILKVLARASLPPLPGDAARECISILDRAIIIAGAATDDTRRDHVVHDVIKQLQSDIPCRPPSIAVLVAGQTPVQRPLSVSRNSVPTLATLPSIFSPQQHWSRAPFAIPAYADHWPAMHHPHQWASLPYLFSLAGPGRIVPVEVGDDYRSDEWTQKLISWEDFLSSLDPSSVHRPHQTIYLAQHSLFTQFPQLRDDIILPDISSAWLGPKGTISPAHTDPFFNCYVQVVGRKTVWLAPPTVGPAIHNPAAGLMSNTSQVDVFPTTLGETVASQSAFPLFWDTVPDEAYCVTLNPGDLLFFPPGWWHAMRSEDVSFSVSMWF